MAENNPLLSEIARHPLLVDLGAEAHFRECIAHVVSHERYTELEASARAEEMSEDSEFWYASDDWRSTYRPYNVKNGILQIPVMGVLLNRFPWQLGRWATGYDYIAKAIARGLADGNVRGIAFIHDSPGGEVAGCFECGDKVYEARKTKPTRAFAADHSYSASYCLSSAAGSLSVTRSGGVGSIGVVTAHVEYSDALKQAGVKVTFIFAGKHKVDGNAYEKLPESVKTRIQQRIDKIYGVFVGAVARNRSLDESAVRATEALTYDSEDAIKAKLADRVGALDDEMVLFSTEIDIGDEQMAVDATDKGIPQAQHDEAVKTARAEGVAEGTKAGADAANARFKAIVNSEAGQARPKAAAKYATNDKFSALDADAIVEMLGDLPEEKAEAPKPKGKDKTEGKTHFEQHMENQNVRVGAETGDDDEDEQADTPEAKANSILADYGRVTGVAKSA